MVQRSIKRLINFVYSAEVSPQITKIRDPSQGLEGHWDTIRPGMLRKVMNVRAHASAGAPLAAFTATITKEELQTVEKAAGGREPLVLVAQGPIQAHFKICAVQRPSSQVDFLGDITPQGVLRPGLLHLLRLLVLDRFLAALKAGSLDSFPKTIVFFRGSEAMGLTNSYLIRETGERTYDTSPFAMNHSSLSTTDEMMINSKQGGIHLYLTTNRMLLGVNIPGMRHVIMVRPPNLQHAVVQVSLI